MSRAVRAPVPPSEPSPALPQSRRVVFALMGQVFISMIGTSLVSPILPLYAQSFGVTAVVAGGLVTAFGIARILVNVPAGSLGERIGRRPLLVGGLLITALGALLSGLATQFWQLMAFRFLQGVGSAAQTTTAMITLADISTSRDRGRNMSMHQGSLLLGSGVGPAIGGFLAEAYGYRAPFFGYAGMALLAALWAYLIVPETKGLAGAGSRPSHGRRGEGTTGGRRAVLDLLATPGFMLVSLVTFAIFFTRSGGRSFVLPLLAHNRLGLSEGQMGTTFSVIAAFNFFTINLSGVLCDRYGRKAVIVPASILSGAALVLFTLSRGYGAFTGCGALLGVATGLAGPAPAAYVADITPPGRTGVTMGLYRTIGDVGMSIGPLLLGWIVDHVGYSQALWVNAGLFVVAGAAFGLLAKETAGRHVRATRPVAGA